MHSSPSTAHHRPTPAAADLAGQESYRALSLPAVVALLLGLASLLAWAHPLLWSVPVVGIVVALVALAQIRRDASTLSGEKLAWLGLALAVINLAAVVTHWGVHRLAVRREANLVALAWFDDIRHGRAYAAHQLMLLPIARLAPGTDLAAAYADMPKLRANYNADFASLPLVRALTQLPADAQIRLYTEEGFSRPPNMDRVQPVYAVTYTRNGQRKSFFVKLMMHRLFLPGTNRLAWRVLPFGAAYTPKNLAPNSQSAPAESPPIDADLAPKA